MRVDELAPSPGSNTAKSRVGRGIGGKGGKTAGRGMKGQGARGSVKPGFEGGQTPLGDEAVLTELFGADLGSAAELLERVEVHDVVLHPERVVETLELRHALLQRHLTAFEAARDLAAPS